MVNYFHNAECLTRKLRIRCTLLCVALYIFTSSIGVCSEIMAYNDLATISRTEHVFDRVPTYTDCDKHTSDTRSRCLRAVEFARTMRGIKDEEAEEIKAFVRKINTPASAHGIPGFNIRESQGYIAPNPKNVIRNSISLGIDTLQKNLYEATSGAADFFGFDDVREWADRKALVNDIDIRRNPAHKPPSREKDAPARCYSTYEDAWAACNAKYNGKCRYLGKQYQVCKKR